MTAQTAKAIRRALLTVNHNPSEAQKEAGNYKKHHLNFQGLNIALENRKGSTRSGVGPDKKRWSCVLPADYGYIKRTEGADGDHVDVYLGPNKFSPVTFIVNQKDHRTNRFDEHKVMLGYNSEREAITDYCKAFSDGKGAHRIASVETVSIDALKQWLKNGKTKSKAHAPSIVDHALMTCGKIRATRQSLKEAAHYV